MGSEIARPPLRLCALDSSPTPPRDVSGRTRFDRLALTPPGNEQMFGDRLQWEAGGEAAMSTTVADMSYYLIGGYIRGADEYVMYLMIA